jgi:tetratricopeptide (TPR) repeat protein
MGIFTKFFGGADGIREAMRDSYEKHVRLAKEGKIPSTDPPHSVGLYGALCSRYRARGKPVVEVVLWGELAPFLLMKEDEAVEALAEYVVYKEMPNKARIAWLKELINSSIESCKDNSRKVTAAIGLLNQVTWCSLLEPKVIEAIERILNDELGFSSDKVIVCPICGTKNKISADRPIEKAKCGKCKHSLQQLQNLEKNKTMVKIFDSNDIDKILPNIVHAEPKSALEVFESRPGWKKLTPNFLNALANKLRTVDNATEFARLCEKTGILENNILGLANIADVDPEFAIGTVTTTLNSYANKMGEQRKFIQAKKALELALLLKPRYVPTWVSMALVTFNMGDCILAISWADKVLSFKPDSKDIWERGLTIDRTPEDEKELSEVFDDPGFIGSRKRLEELMKSIKKACDK